MWESRFGDFQGQWETLENLPLVFLVFHCPPFPQPSSPLSSCRLPAPKSGEQLLFFFLHPSCARRIALSSCSLVHRLHGPFRLQIPRQVRQLPQNLPRRRIPTIDPSLLALGAGHHFRHSAWPV